MNVSRYAIGVYNAGAGVGVNGFGGRMAQEGLELVRYDGEAWAGLG